MRAPQIWPGNTKAVSPGCLGVTAWRRRCGLHRRTTGGWSQTGRELGVGDVVIAESGDTCALYVGCRSAGLKADSPLRRQLIRFVTGWMRWACRVPLSEICTAAGVAGMNAREDRWSSGMFSRAVTGPLVRKICTNPSSRTSRLAMGGLVPGLSKRSSSTLGEYRKSDANTFCHAWMVPLLTARWLSTRRDRRHEDDLVRSASAAMIASRCSPYLSAFVGPRPCTLTSSPTLRGRASAMAISVASVKTQ